jgi:hypothetical protein
LNKLWTRWVLAVALSCAAFAVCWALLEFASDTDTAVALGWAILPFSVVLALTGVWADNARGEGDKNDDPTDSRPAKIDQKQHAGNNSHQIQIGGDLRINDRDR